MTPQRFYEQRLRAIGTEHRLLCTHPGSLAGAVRWVSEYLERLDASLSRFRPDSEVSRLAAMTSGGRPSAAWAVSDRAVTVQISDLFAEYVRAALTAARLTGGLVDPTIGRALISAGYDADLDVVRARDGAGAGSTHRRFGATLSKVRQEIPGWRRVDLDADQNLTIPLGCVLDLGATAKAHAADLMAAHLGRELPGGFLVNLGGDIAVGGDLPEGGWQIGVEAADGAIRQSITSTGQAVATSSTQLRRWTAGGESRHHIIDPRTGVTADATWAQVTCAAATALEANAASTAAIVLGPRAPDWLCAVAIPARLDPIEGPVVTTPGWPDPAADFA